MTTTVNYGEGAICQLDAHEVTHLRPAASVSLAPDQVALQLREALCNPLGYPALDSAIVPGDQVVLALGANVPEIENLVTTVLSVLHDAGVDSEYILLLSAASSGEDFSGTGLQHEIHDPDDEDQIALLGVTASGRPLRFNRTLCESDLVLPIGCCSTDLQQQEQQVKFSGLFPQFSDRETMNRFFAPIGTDNRVQRSQRCEETDDALWRLGVGMVVQVVPSSAGGVAEVLVGESAAVTKAASAKYRSIWECETTRRADLVVASITGEQSWQSFGRALAAAESVLEDYGTIAICSQLSESLGPSLQRLVGSDDFAAEEREIMRDRAADSWPAIVLARAVERGAVYLRSQLESELVESLGMTPIASDEELSRLASVGEHCIVLEQAQRLVPVVNDE